jgi:hypothetical protein
MIVETAAILVVSEHEHLNTALADIWLLRHVTVEFVALDLRVPAWPSIADPATADTISRKAAGASNDGYSYYRQLHTHERQHQESTGNPAAPLLQRAGG